MADTYRDKLKAKRRRTRNLSWDLEYETIEYEYVSRYDNETYTGRVYIERAGVHTKKKRNYLEFEHHWYRHTPGWWVREFMTSPKRAACRNWEKDVAKRQDLEEIPDCPDFGRKPHVYYW